MYSSKQMNKREIPFVIDIIQPEFFVPGEFLWFYIYRVCNYCQGLHFRINKFRNSTNDFGAINFKALIFSAFEICLGSKITAFPEMQTFCFNVCRLILINLNSYFIFSSGLISLTFVVAPPFKVRSTGLFVCQAPRVKSGISTVLDFLATDRSLKGIRQLQDAASYTS